MVGRKKSFVPKLSAQDEQAIKGVLASRTEEFRRVQRAKIISMAADGQSNTHIAATLDVSRPVVNKVVKRFSTAGLQAALADAPRSGRPTEFARDERAWIIALACSKPQEVADGPALALWTISALTSYVHCKSKDKHFDRLERIAPSSVWKILNDHSLKPHKIRYYLERTDPEFESRAQQVLLLYKRIEWITQLSKRYGSDHEELSALSGEAFVSYDEKPGIQALANVHPDLAPDAGHGTVRRDYEYVRHGTVSLLAGIDLFNGQIHSIVRESHTSADFIDFLKLVDTSYDASLTINVILDNHSTHRSKETMAYLATRPNRFKFTFTPKHGSWLNLVESFFSKLARSCLRGLRVDSKDALIKQIQSWIDAANKEPVTFRWSWHLDDIENAFI